MAQSLETIRSSLLTTIFGRRFGLTPDEYIGGTKELKVAIEDISTTIPTTVLAYGITRILTSGSSQGPTQHFLPAPVPGVEKSIFLNSTSTGSQQFLSTANGASIIATSIGTTVGVINFVGPGGSIVLVGGSTVQWLIKSIEAVTSTALAQAITFTTST